MNRASLRKLIGPAIVFALFLIAGIRTEDVLQRFGLAAWDQTQLVFNYAFQVGLWLSAAFLVNRLINVLFWDGVVSHAIQGQIPRLLRDLTGFVVYAIAATGIMAVVFEQPVTGFWATSGVMGVVLGFALRNIILDVFMGLAINVDRPYTIGDWIMVVDNPGDNDRNLIGCVQEINWRTTRLRTTDNNMLVIPNNVMGQKVVTNFMNPGEQSRFELDFTLDFSVPTDRALRVLTAAVKAVADETDGPVSEPRPKARVTGITENGVSYRLRYWIIPRLVSPARARHTVISSVLQHLNQAGMQLAYPKRDTFLASMPKRLHEHADVRDRRELLSRVAWMAAFTMEELGRLADNLLPRQFPEGATMMAEGESGSSMFIVVEGLLEVYSRIPGETSEIQVGKLNPGDFYGEMSLLTGEARSATIKAATDTIAYEIRKEHMEELLKERPQVAEAISRIVAKRRVATEKALSENAAPDVEEQAQGLAEVIFEKIKGFFSGVFGGAGGDVPGTLDGSVHSST